MNRTIDFFSFSRTLFQRGRVVQKGCRAQRCPMPYIIGLRSGLAK
jgi:hypothetical protein